MAVSYKKLKKKEERNGSTFPVFVIDKMNDFEKQTLNFINFVKTRQ